MSIKRKTEEGLPSQPPKSAVKVDEDKVDVPMEDILGFVEQKPTGLVKLRFWDKVFTVPRSDLLESEYFRRFLGEQGMFKTKPLDDGSYFINESGEDFEEILYHLRGETLDRDQRLQTKMMRFLPPEMLEVQSETEAQNEIAQRIIGFLRGWLKVKALSRNVGCFRMESGTPKPGARRPTRTRRFFFQFSIMEVASKLDGGARIFVEEGDGNFISAFLWLEIGLLDTLIAQSPLNFMAEMPDSSTGYSSVRGENLVECQAFVTKESMILTANEVDTDPLPANIDKVKDPISGPEYVAPPPTVTRDPFADAIGLIRCNRCPQEFGDMFDLRQHMTRRHNGDPGLHPIPRGGGRPPPSNYGSGRDRGATTPSALHHARG